MFEVVVGEDTLWVSHGDFDGTGVLQAFVVESDWSLALEKKKKNNLLSLASSVQNNYYKTKDQETRRKKREIIHKTIESHTLNKERDIWTFFFNRSLISHWFVKTLS